MRTGVRAVVGAAVLAALAALVGGGATAATATTPSYVVMFSDSGDYIGGGLPREFDSGNAQISVSGTASDLSVGAAGGTAGDSYSLEFAAPPGNVLATGGIYTGAQRAPFREAGHPGIDIGGSGRGCNTDTGLFEVKDIATNAAGAISRLWIVYEQHCEGGTAALWGEVKLGEPGSATPLVAPGIVRWPESDVGALATVVPVTVTALGAPETISGASLAGANPSDFRIRADDCSGKTLATGGSCQVWVRFAPGAAGTRLATLHLTDTSGGAFDVALQGFAYGGTTKVTMTSDPGDYIGQGVPWSYTVANASIYGGGGRTYAGFGVSGANGDWWSADFVPASGDILVAGSTYANATRYPFNGPGPGLDVSGNGRGCNTLTGSFTVTAANFASDGSLESIAVNFVQHCEGATPALRGTFSYRAGDTTQPAPWMVASVPPPPPPPPSSSPPSINSFAPGSGTPGTTVTITGTNLTGTSGVTFGGVNATFNVMSSTQLTATVPQNATTGPISVTTAAGTAVSSASFTVTAPPPAPAPTLTSFTPTAGQPGTTVTLTGTNFAGTTAVSFAGTSAVFNVVTASTISTSVPAGAASGKISVTTPGGAAQSVADFTVTTAPAPAIAPAISSFTPVSAPPGTSVTVTGSHLDGATAVAFAGTAAVFNVTSPTEITTVVPAGASTGKLSVTTPAGVAQSAGDFTVTVPSAPPAPSVTVPGAPTGVTAAAGDGQATVTFAAPGSNGGSAITSYTVTASPGGGTATGPGSPLTVSGLSNGTSYTFTVTASNAAGTGPVSAPSSPVTPSAPATGGGSGGGGGGSGGVLPADLLVRGLADTATAAVGGQITYTLTIQDQSGGAAPGVHVRVELPSGAALVSSSTDRGAGCAAVATGTLDCTVGDLSGATARVVLVVRVVAPGLLTLRATATYLFADPNPADNAVVVLANELLPAAASPHAPSQVKPMIGPPLLSSAPRAGRRATIAFRVTRSDNGALLRTARVTCSASISGKAVRTTEQFRNGTARLSFLVPKGASGKVLRLKVTIRLAGVSATRIARFRVK